MTDEELGKIVDDAAFKLGEHFDAVQILASNSDSEGTYGKMRGVGNFYARLGMAREFIDKDTNEMLGSKIADALNEDSDED